MIALTREQALVIRTWRVDLGCSWRKVAELACSAFGAQIGPPPTQELGARLCEIAADILGENPGEEPWN